MNISKSIREHLEKKGFDKKRIKMCVVLVVVLVTLNVVSTCVGNHLRAQRYAEMHRQSEAHRIEIERLAEGAARGDVECLTSFGMRCMRHRDRESQETGVRYLLDAAERGGLEAVRYLLFTWAPREATRGSTALWKLDSEFSHRLARVDERYRNWLVRQAGEEE